MASPRFIQPSGAGRDYLAVTIGAYIREPVRCCSLDFILRRHQVTGVVKGSGTKAGSWRPKTYKEQKRDGAKKSGKRSAANKKYGRKEQ